MIDTRPCIKKSYLLINGNRCCREIIFLIKCCDFCRLSVVFIVSSFVVALCIFIAVAGVGTIVGLIVVYKVLKINEDF